MSPERNRVTAATDLWGARGVRVLHDVRKYLARFVAYPDPAALIAHTLWVAHTHRMDLWDSTPRIAFLSPEPGSGKSRALEVTDPLVPRPIHAVNVSPAYLFRKVSDEDGAPTILFDEADTVFGTRAKENEDLRGLLNAGHRKGAVAGRCKTIGKTIITEELPAYAAVALAGLDDLPDTIMSRCVVVRMRRRGPTESIEAFRHRLHAAEGNVIRDDLAEWAASLSVPVWPEMPVGVEDRAADVWEALLVVADAAGGDWPQRAREAAVTLVGNARDDSASLGVRLLEDLQTVFDGRPAMASIDILAALHELEESPWGDLRGKPITAQWLSQHLKRYGVVRGAIRIDGRVVKGYMRAALEDPWSRYLTPPPPPEKPVAAVTRLHEDDERECREAEATRPLSDPLSEAVLAPPCACQFGFTPSLEDPEFCECGRREQ